MSTLTEIYDLVRIHLARVQATQSHYYNLRQREWRCRLGDQVMRREHPLSYADKSISAKFSPKYSGPFTVIKIHSAVIYDIKAEYGRKISRIHVKDLKPINLMSVVSDVGTKIYHNRGLT